MNEQKDTTNTAINTTTPRRRIDDRLPTTPLKWDDEAEQHKPAPQPAPPIDHPQR